MVVTNHPGNGHQGYDDIQQAPLDALIHRRQHRRYPVLVHVDFQRISLYRPVRASSRIHLNTKQVLFRTGFLGEKNVLNTITIRNPALYIHKSRKIEAAGNRCARNIYSKIKRLKFT